MFLKSSHAVALPAPASGNAPDWIQVFPSGTFSGRDGRGPYTCDPAAVVARTREHNGPVDIPVDYDHQLEHTAMNGRPAIAAGWITELEARADGVWGRVDWTDKGKGPRRRPRVPLRFPGLLLRAGVPGRSSRSSPWHSPTFPT